MPQIIKGTTFVQGQRLTAALLNKLIDDATLADIPASLITGTIPTSSIPSNLSIGKVVCTSGKLAGGVGGVLGEVTPSARFSFTGSALDIAANSITPGYQPTVAASKLIGRGSASGDGNREEITPSDGVEISGTNLRLSNPDLRSLQAGRLLGRQSGSPGAPEDIYVSTGLTLAGNYLSAETTVHSRFSIENFHRASALQYTQTVDSFDAAADTLTIATNTPSVGDCIVTSTPIAGLSANTAYFVVWKSGNSVKVAQASPDNPVHNITVTGPGASTFNFYFVASSGLTGVSFDFAHYQITASYTSAKSDRRYFGIATAEQVGTAGSNSYAMNVDLQRIETGWVASMPAVFSCLNILTI